MRLKTIKYLLLFVWMMTAWLPVYSSTGGNNTKPKRLSPPITYTYLEYISTDKWRYTENTDGTATGATAYGLTIDDIYNDVMAKQTMWPDGFTRELFVNTYLDQDGSCGPLYQDPALDEKGESTLPENTDELQQYTVTYRDGKPTFSIATSVDKKIGKITWDHGTILQREYKFIWEMSKDEAIAKFGENKDVAIACLLKSVNYAYPDIYIIFKSDPNNISFNEASSGIEVNSTNFPDEAFRNWVLQNVSGASDGVLTDEEITSITSIDCSGKYNAYGEMANLKGIEFFTSLKTLICRYNKLTNLNLSKNTALTSLDCGYNQLKSFDISGCTELASLYCTENGLTSLNVGNNMALTSLSCYDNQLTSLNLSNHTALKSVDCQYNQLTNLNVSNCTSLSYLQCNTNELTNIDVSTCTALANLYCHYNKLTSLDVRSNSNLKMLYCNNNQMTSLDVSKNTSLTSLVCDNNQLIYINLGTNNKIAESSTSISPQSAALSAQNISEGIAIPVPSDFDYSKVSNLKLAGTSVTGSVATINGQKYLVFAKTGTAESAINGKMLTYTYNTGNSFNKASSVDVTVTLSYTATTPTGIEVNAINFPDEAFRNWILQNVSGASDGVLTDEEIEGVLSIDFGGTSKNIGSISSLQGIEFFTALTYLDCSYNKLTALDVSKNTALITLYCLSNQLISLDVSKNIALTTLDCDSNQLTSLNVSQNTALEVFSCHINKLTSLDVTNNTALTILDCDGNQLTDLDLTKNTALKSLSCSSNKLKTLDLTNNTALTSIICGSNQLTSLDLSKNLDLSFLNCWSNKLTSVDVTKLTALTFLSFNYNQLTDLDVSKNTALRELYLNSNQLTTLDVTKNTALENLYCADNQLTDLDVRTNTALKQLQCENNQLLYLLLANNTHITYATISSQSLSLPAVVISSGIAIPVPLDFDLAKVTNLKLNGTSVSGKVTTVSEQKYLVFAQPDTPQSAIDGKQLTYDYDTDNSFSQAVFMSVKVQLSYTFMTYSLSIQSGAGGSVSYDGTTITNKTQSFTIAEGSSVTIEMTPSNGYKLASLVVNGTDVTSGVANNQYTISNITANTTVVVTFKALPLNITVDGINYEVKSATDYTLNVGKGDYSGHVVIPVTVSYDGDTWTVAGVVDGSFNLSAITAITWNPNTAIGNGAFGTQTNPNLLLYVKSEAYAPSNVQNVIANGRAKKIVLTDAVSGNDFNCPEAFTAEEISYTHQYGMTTGIGECRGWETIALPFDVKQFTHESKGALVPFKAYYSGSPNKPFWLYELSASGFVEAESIEAYTPYIISMPNNDYYDTAYHLSGRVTFAATNAKVGVTELKRPKSGEKTFVPNFSMQAASESIFPLNVNNDFFNNNEYYAEGSHFVKGSRHVLPFEAYMTTSTANAKGFIPIFETQPTAIRDIPMQGLWGETGVKVYSLNGQLVLWSESMTREEALRRLPAGIYIINGKKITIK